MGFKAVKGSMKGIAVQLALLVCIIANCLPFSLIESPHFIAWMALIGIAYPSRTTLMKLLPVLYRFVMTQRCAALISCGVFATTFDMWTSISGGHYLVVTYHAIDPDFKVSRINFFT